MTQSKFSRSKVFAGLAGLALSAVAGSAQAGFFPSVLATNTTSAPDSTFLGAPDDVFLGIGGKTVIYDFGARTIINRPGLVDFNVYEVDFGAVEFSAATFWASADGVTYVDVSASMVTVVSIAGDEAHGSTSFAKSFDLGVLATARYIMIDGDGDGPSGSTTGFDLDAIGAHEVTPIPEPATTALMLAGLGALGFIARRRQPR